MDIDADNHGEEGVSFSDMDAHILQMVIIEHPVIDPFAGGAVIVDFLILFCSPWDRGIEAKVPVRLGVDAAAIGRRGAFLLTGAGVSLAAGQRTAPFTGMLLFTVSPVDHPQASHAQTGEYRLCRW